MNQREGVFAAIVSVLGEVNGAVSLTDSQKKAVYATLHTAFMAGEIDYKGEKTAEKIAKYVPGLVNNWLRKDPNLNGNVKYVTKNPGSRAGSGDEQLRVMKQLLAATSDPAARIEIEDAIKLRQEELKPRTEIKVDALPPHLRKFAKVG